MTLDLVLLASLLDRLEQDASLNSPDQFVERVRAADSLELSLLLEEETLGAGNPLTPLLGRARALCQRWDEVNAAFIQSLLDQIRANQLAAVRAYFWWAWQQLAEGADPDEAGYDALDMLTNSLLEIGQVPDEPQPQEAELVFYQPTPTRIILRLLDVLQLQAGDVFYDIGSGLGQVPLLVNLFAGVPAKGVELEQAYHQHAVACQHQLGLTHVEFIHADARDVDYAVANVFYLYTPFVGQVLQQVLGRLRAEASQREIKVCTYGPCTMVVREARWLKSVYESGAPEVRVGVFESG